mmetsp:Transcript_68543/g.149729  ORF Transcript_68543/g.149729 Transcript_68543/m.149729 type:complete len:511 (+) Transcript_68543:97-1629(+)
MAADSASVPAATKGGVEKSTMVAVLKRNPASLLYMLYFGIHSAMMAVPYYLVIYDLGAQVWGKSMTHRLVLFDGARLILGVVCSGLFGTLGDRLGNHVTVTIELLFGFAPILLIMLIGRTPTGLYVFCAVRALSGLTGASTVTSAPCLYAYAHELVVRNSDYATLTGLLFAVSCIMTMTGLLVGRRVDVAAGPTGVLWMGFGMFVVQATILLTLRTPLLRRLSQKWEVGRPVATTDGNPESSESDSNIVSEVPAAPAKGKKSPSPFAWIKLARENRSLLRVCLIAMLVCMAEMVLSDIKAQYAFSCFDILEGKEFGKKRRGIAFMVTVCIWCNVGVSCLVMGFLSRCFSPFVLLKWTTLFIVLCQLMPVILAIHASIPVLIVSSSFIGLAYAVLPPLQAAVPEVVPANRVSEAIGAMGSCKCMAYLITTVILTVGLPALEQAQMDKPLWTLFPLCAAMALMAFPLAWNLKPLSQTAAGSELAASKSDSDDISGTSSSSIISSSEAEGVRA